MQSVCTFTTIVHAAVGGKSSAAIYTVPNGKQAVVKEIMAVPDRSQVSLYVGKSGQAVIPDVGTNTTLAARIIALADPDFGQISAATMTASTVNILARNTILESGDYIAIWSHEAGAATLNINILLSIVEN